jgi:hypothetical protein
MASSSWFLGLFGSRAVGFSGCWFLGLLGSRVLGLLGRFVAGVSGGLFGFAASAVIAVVEPDPVAQEMK